MKIPVSNRALRSRIGRVLKAKGQRLTVDRRGGRLGYLVVSTKGVIKADVDVGALALELGVVRDWEQLRPATKDRNRDD